MENVYRFFRRVSFSYKMSSVLNDWRTFFTIDLLIPLMQMMCYSLVGYYVYGAENIEKWVISNAIVTSAFTAIYRVGLQLNIVGVTPSDTFFQANSLLGDELTIIDNKDLITDIDAYVLKYHPKFKDLPLNERIEKYYSTDNLNKKREEYYKEVLELKSEGTGVNNYSTILKFGSMFTFAALGLFLLNIKNGISDFLKNPKKMIEEKIIKEKIIPSLINNFEELKKDPLAYATKKTSARFGNFVADTIVTAKAVVTFTANKINNKIIKPIVNRVVKPIYNAVIRPISSFTYNKVVKPIYNNVVKPVYNKVTKPVVKWGYNNIVKPVYNKAIKPVAKWGYNNVVKPFVEPIYNKVVKPASNWISDKYNKAKNWFKKWF